MEKKFRSKIGPELAIPLSLILAITAISLSTGSIGLIGMIIIAGVTAFFIHMFLTTYYIVREDKLRIKCGFIVDTEIQIKSIKRISETNSIMGSPAASLDRLEIEYNKYDSVLISPGEKAAFIDMLIRINPDIEIKYKKAKS